MSFVFFVVVVVYLLSCVCLFATPWTAARQASLSFTISWSLLRFVSIESVVLTISSSAPLFFCLQSFPATGYFPVSRVFTSSGQSIGASASASVFPMNIQGWFPLGLTRLILQSEKLSRIFSTTTVVQKWLSVEFSSVAQSCPTLCDPMNHSTPGLPVHRQLSEFTQTQVHQVSDAIQPSHPRSSPSPPAPNPAQHQSLFQWLNSSHEVAKVLEFQL